MYTPSPNDIIACPSPTRQKTRYILYTYTYIYTLTRRRAVSPPYNGVGKIKGKRLARNRSPCNRVRFTSRLGSLVVTNDEFFLVNTARTRSFREYSSIFRHEVPSRSVFSGTRAVAVAEMADPIRIVDGGREIARTLAIRVAKSYSAGNDDHYAGNILRVIESAPLTRAACFFTRKVIKQ